MTLVNKYAGTCAACKGRVEAETGTRANMDGAWLTYHHECAPEREPRAQTPAAG